MPVLSVHEMYTTFSFGMNLLAKENYVTFLCIIMKYWRLKLDCFLFKLTDPVCGEVSVSHSGDGRILSKLLPIYLSGMSACPSPQPNLYP